MPKEPQRRATRQQPISCRSCRSRKLRCDREFPCSNCASRGVACELENAVRPPPTPGRSLEAELLERVRKLERLAESQGAHRNEIVTPLYLGQGAPSRSSSSSVASVSREAPSPEIESLNSEIAYLESIYSDSEQLQDKTLSNSLVFKSCPIGQITNAPAYINRSTTSFEPVRCIWLPPYSEAKILVEKYVEDVDHVYHIVYTPSLFSLLSGAYACLSDPDAVLKHGGGFFCLFLGIFASATNSWTQLDCGRGLFSTSAEANAQAPLWVKALEDVLDIAHRTMGVSMEGIQGVTIAAFVVLTISGFSRRCKALFNMALLLARDAGLHVLDHPSNAGHTNLVRTEIGRRLWWHLVASDWQAPARFDGAVHGVYHCHPRHMVVRKPLNLNDEDLLDGMSQDQKPLSFPTVMSYQLQRIRIAEIMRMLIDRNELTMSHAGDLSHNIISNRLLSLSQVPYLAMLSSLEIDTEMQLFINDIPPFFSMTTTELEANYKISPLRAKSIFQQGFCLYSLTWSQRCRLHIPYFSRGFVELEYAASRDICLHSARQIIRTEVMLGDSGIITATRYKLLGLLTSVFMASVVVLLGDINQKKSTAQQGIFSEDVLGAIRILEHARHESETAAKFLESLMCVVNKQNLFKPAAHAKSAETGSGDARQYDAASTQPEVGSLLHVGRNNLDAMDVLNERPENGEDLSVYLNGLAQSFEQCIDVGSIDWDSMLGELERSIV